MPDVYLGTVRNRAKLAYPAVGAWLEGQAPAPPTLTRSMASRTTCACRIAAARR